MLLKNKKMFAGILLALIACEQNSEHSTQTTTEKTSLPSNSDLLSYNLRHNKITVDIRIPSKWTTNRLSPDVFSFRNVCGNNTKFCSNAVVKFTEKGQSNLKDVLAIATRSIQDSYSKYKIVSKSLGIFSGDSIAVIDYKFYVNHANLGASTAIIIHNNSIVSITYTGLNEPAGAYAGERVVFQNIIDELRIHGM